MSSLLIENARVVLLDRVEEGWCVLADQGRIERVGPRGEFGEAEADCVVDAARRYLAPGYVDIFIHGCHEFLTTDGPAALAGMTRVLPRYGVTSFQPTLAPLPKGEDAALLATLARVRSQGAEILGFFLEGPFLTITGALPREALGKADPERVRALQEAASPHQVIFAVSPEFEGIGELMPLLTAGGVPAFITHTRARVEETKAAIEAGARHAAHFYDVFYPPEMAEPGKRPCGAVEAILADERVSVSFILDGEHVDPVAVRMALQCKGPGGVCLVTDANRGAGLPPGRHRFGEFEIEFAYPGAPARFTRARPEYPGLLAGSGLTLDRAVRNAIEMVGVDLPTAVRMASHSPACVIGAGARKGCIAEGFDADLVLLDDDLRPVRTWVGGAVMFERG